MRTTCASSLMEITEEIKALFKKCREYLGAPIVEVELTDEQLCSLLSIALDDYLEVVRNWVIEQQWSQLYGRNMTTTDITFALSMRGLDDTKNWSDWFSKQVGLQQRGGYELKKDFFKIECGKQDYIIPAGREINRVLWMNPPTTQAAMYANWGGIMGVGLGMGGYGYAAGVPGAYAGMGGFYFGQAMDIAYLATDLQYKTRMFNGDMTYKVTAGPDGTHIVHLFGNPRRFSFYMASPGSNLIHLPDCEVWYTYYDTTGDADADKCRKLNPDVILSPDQVPLNSETPYEYLNSPTKTIVRKLFFAKAMRTLAFVRGKFSGVVSIPEATVTMDYNMLLSQSENEYKETMEELRERLSRLHPANLMKLQAEMTDNMMKILAGTPLKAIVR